MRLLRLALPAAAIATLLAAAPFDVASLKQYTAKPAPQQMLATVDGKTIPLRREHRPVVLVLFASWCVGCMDEMPRVLADYRRFKDRVDFIGIDYEDGASGLKAVMRRFAIPFPVVRPSINDAAPAPLAPGAKEIGTERTAIHGMTAKNGMTIVDDLAKALPSKAAALHDVAAKCAALDENACDAYARANGLDFDRPGATNIVQLDPQAPVTPDAHQDDILNLPYLFVLDATGIVRLSEEGYDSAHDPIVAALSRLGIK